MQTDRITQFEAEDARLADAIWQVTGVCPECQVTYPGCSRSRCNHPRPRTRFANDQRRFQGESAW